MRSRSNNVTATPCRARSVAAVEPAGPPPTTTTSSPLTRVVLHRLLDRAGLELLVRGRIDVERAGQVQLPGHLATGWDDFLPIRRRERIASLWSIAPSPSQKKIDP